MVVFFYVIGSLMCGGGVFIEMLSNTSMHDITAAILFGSGIITMALAVIINRLESR